MAFYKIVENVREKKKKKKWNHKRMTFLEKNIKYSTS